MKAALLTGCLLALIMAGSLLQQLTEPRMRMDDFAVMKYLAHSTDATDAAMLSAARAGTDSAYEIDRYEIRTKTRYNYPFANLLIRLFDLRLAQYSFLSVFLAFALTMGLSLAFYLWMRVRYPTPYGSAIDVALVGVAFTMLLYYHGIGRAYPFGGGAPWFDVFPRGWIELLFISLIYPFTSPRAARRDRIALLAGVTVFTLLLNSLFAAMLLGLGAAAWLLAQRWYPFRFEYLLPCLYALLIAAFHFTLGMQPEFVIRAALWAAWSVALLYWTRTQSGSAVRNAFIFLASVSLAAYFFKYDFSSQTDAGVFQFTIRATGMAQFAFFLLLATRLTERIRTQILKLSFVPFIVFLALIWIQRPADHLLERLEQPQTIPSPQDETGFFQYFTWQAINAQPSSRPQDSAALPR